MMKLETVKNTFVKAEDFTDAITQEEYEIKILDEAVEKLKSGKATFYTHREFWENVKKGMVKDNETISHNI